MNEANVQKWCVLFNEGTTSMPDEARSGRSSVITTVDTHIRYHRVIPIDEFHVTFYLYLKLRQVLSGNRMQIFKKKEKSTSLFQEQAGKFFNKEIC